MSGNGRPLVIVGAGGLGRETIALVRAINATRPASPAWDLLGLLDDGPDRAGDLVDGVAVLGPTGWLDETAARPGAVVPHVVLCTGSPKSLGSRAAIAARLDPRTVFAPLVHPTASLAVGTEVGHGSVLLAQVVTTAPVSIGRHVVVMPQVVFTHDDVIGDHATFGAGVRLAGGVTVGAGAYLGSGALVREHLTIGAGALVGMGAVVTRDVPPGEVWAGNPARYQRDVAATSVAPTNATEVS
jgi:sugar O-acyltransferase (sialic acid O-acetyltransferase NeuD family)